MDEKLVSNMNRDELVQFIRTEGAKQYQAQNGSALPPLVRPAEIDDPNTPPELRAKVVEQYVGALMDRPQNTWTPADRALIAQQVRTVLKNMGF